MQLLVPKSEIAAYAARYKLERGEDEIVALRASVQAAGYLSKSQLSQVAWWKSPRSSPHIAKSSDEFIRDITNISLRSKHERTKIEVLTILDGVQWPTASVVLHLFHDEPYPILDSRALWSINTKVPKQYTFSLWNECVEFCRDLSNSCKVNMRTLDRALWQYSLENQKSVA